MKLENQPLIRLGVVDKDGQIIARNAKIEVSANLPVRIHFNGMAIGTVENVHIERDWLVGDVTLTKGALKLLNTFEGVFRPGGLIKRKRTVTVVEEMKLFEVAVIKKENDVYEEEASTQEEPSSGDSEEAPGSG